MQALPRPRLRCTDFLRALPDSIASYSVPAVSGRRDETETFIREVFQRRYDARVPAFAPELLMLEQGERIVAAAGWRGAGASPLYLERYLDAPVEIHIASLGGQDVPRHRIAEVGNLAAVKPGSGVRMILSLAEQLHQSGYEWVVFTATDELIRILTRMGMPPLALQVADPARLGDEARAWGRYYDTRPVVVAGRIRQGLVAKVQHV